MVQLIGALLQYFFANMSEKENIYRKMKTWREEEKRGKEDRDRNRRHAAVYRIQ
jgi:hypothetical protein